MDTEGESPWKDQCREPSSFPFPPRENALSCDRGGLAGARAQGAQGTKGRERSNCLLRFLRAPSGPGSVPVNRIQTRAAL